MSKSKLTSLICPDLKVNEEQLETDRKLIEFDRSIAHLNRRNFLGTLMAAAAAATVAGSTRSAFAQSATPSVTDVLNFALNLEYLEANFYSYVSTGAGLSTSIQGSGAGTIQNPPAKLALDPITTSIAAALLTDEINHINFIRSTITQLGGTPISQPTINLGAKGAITTQAQFLMAARQFTAVGGSAYAGSAQLLVSNPTVLTAASQILGAEGQHAGALNFQCAYQGVTSPAVDANDVPPTTSTLFTVAASNALAPARSPQQVLGIVYGVTTATSPTTPATGILMGGFFPSGFNGNVKST